MVENPIQPIRRTEFEGVPKVGGTENGAGRANRAKAPEETGAVRAEEASKEREVRPESPEDKPNIANNDIALKFKIDDETQDVTILILNKATHKLVRTIPPEDMNKMDPGELLEMFA